MTDEYRPDPDTLLAALQRNEARQRRGKLKIFLGMAAGVGKTYAMLQAGATTLLSKESAVDELYAAIRQALADEGVPR